MNKKIFRSILYMIQRIKMSNKCNLGKNVNFGRFSSIVYSWGGVHNNLTISDFCRIYGHIHIQGNGVVKLGKHVALGERSRILCVNNIFIDDYTATGPNVTICDNNNHPVNPEDRMIMRFTPAGDFKRCWINSISSPIYIGKNVWIGENTRICKGVKIGDGSVIAANAVVTHDVPLYSIAAGNPAKVVKTDIQNTPRIFNEEN